MAEESAGAITYTVDMETDKLLAGNKATDASLDKLQKGFDDTDKSSRKAGGGVNKLTQAVREQNANMAGATKRTGEFVAGLRTMLPVLLALAGLKKMLDVQREFDVMNAGLVTATKSAEGAKVAFEAISDFAKNTPYDLQQAVDGFTKLVNMGLDPSERALQSYGNTAAALGKDLNQMIEAVADAATGEFERLKEFGIRASKNGDKVALTFQGVTTSVGNSAAEIENYLMAIGENQFAGAMAERMKTLDGALSNTSDSWAGLWRTINEGVGFGEAAAEVVNMIGGAFDSLSAAIKSGQLDAYFEALSSKFSGFTSDITSFVSMLGSLIAPIGEEFGSLGSKYIIPAIDGISDAFKNLPENVRAFIQLMVVEVAASFDKIQAYAGAFVDAIAAVFSDNTVMNVSNLLEKQIEGIDDARRSSIETIMDEREKALKSFDDQIVAADNLRKAYDELNKAGNGDRLAQFKIERDGSAPAEKAKKVKKERQKKEKTPEEISRALDPAAEEKYKFEQELAALQKSNELKLIEDQRYIELKTQLETEHSARMMQIEEQRFAAQSRTNKLLIDSLNEVQAAGTMAITGLLSGTNNLTDAMQQLGAGILHHAVGSLVEMGIQYVKSMVMGQTAQTVAAATAAATGASMAASYAPAAAMASLASFGANAAPASAGIASTVGMATALSVSGGRLNGGPVTANGLYRVNENGKPEIFNAANGQQYMMPNSRGEVVSNKDATGGAGQNIAITITVTDSGTQATQTGSDNGDSMALANGIRVVVIDEIERQSRPGGSLWSMKYNA